MADIYIYIYIVCFILFCCCTYRLPMIIDIDESWMGRVTSPLADAGKLALTNRRAHNDAIQEKVSTKVLRTDCNPLVRHRSTTGIPTIGVSIEMRESPKLKDQEATFCFCYFYGKHQDHLLTKKTKPHCFHVPARPRQVIPTALRIFDFCGTHRCM